MAGCAGTVSDFIFNFGEEKTIQMNDPIGQAIYDYFQTGKNHLLKINTNYTEGETLKPAYFFREFGQMPPIERKALEMCRGRILDIGAGAGCHSLYLQQQGLEVTALEKSELAAEVLRKRGIRQVINDDIFRLKEGAYDTLLLLMNGGGVGGTLPRLQELLLHLQTLLAPGGQILLDSSDITYLFVEDDGSLWIDLASDRYFGEMTYEITYRRKTYPPFPWLFVDFETLKQTAVQTGLECQLIFEGDSNDYLARLTQK